MLWQGSLHRDLVCDVWINDSANRIAEGPHFDIEDWRQVIFFAKVVSQRVWMTIGWEGRDELADNE